MKNLHIVPNQRDEFLALFNFLRGFMPFPDYLFERELEREMVTRSFTTTQLLQSEGRPADKAFYVVSGLVYAYYRNSDHEIVPFRIFRKGKIALIPESFMTGKPAEYALMACGNTRVLEVRLDQMEKIYKAFPHTVVTALQIVASMFEKDRIKNQMLDLGHEGSIRKFFELYPDLFGSNDFQFRDKHIAHYLHMSAISFSRLKHKLFPEFNKSGSLL